MKNYLWTPWRMQYIDKGESGGSGSGSGSAEPAQDKAEGREPQKAQSENKSQPEDAAEGCVFCIDRESPQDKDRKHLILHRGTYSFIILNLYPYNTGHLMVVPYGHTSDFAGLDEQTTGEMTALLQWMLRVIGAEYRPQGFNMGMNMGNVAGAGVADHVHMHVVPRWAGDSNFMPIVGETKVMPELLETTYDRLRSRLQTVK
jgi:ATP adenylyltransferase